MPKSPIYLGFFLDAHYRASQMRSPSPNLSGYIAKLAMKKANKATAEHVVETLLDVPAGGSVVELGPGSGFALRPILALAPAARIPARIPARPFPEPSHPYIYWSLFCGNLVEGNFPHKSRTRKMVKRNLS